VLPFAALALAAACSDANAPQPEAGVFVRTRGQMHTPRVAFGAANVASGALVGRRQDANAKATATGENYDAPASTITPPPGPPTAAPMTDARFRPTVTELEDGRVLITGGRGATEVVLASAEIYDPKTGTLEPTENAMSSSRAAHVAVRLDDGTVLIAGGFDN